MKKSLKKQVSCLLCAVILLCSIVPAFAETPQNGLEPNCVYLGDADKNGAVTATDARRILQAASGARTLSAQIADIADLNRDGRITAVDARYALQTASGVRAKQILNTQTGEITVEVRKIPTTQAEILAYFNTAINDVKPNAKRVRLLHEINSSAGEIQGNLPDSLRSMASSLIATNMGEKDLSQLAPAMVNATTAAQRNAMFPVENTNWSSRLTEADILSAALTEANGIYTIEISVKPDAPSTNVGAGLGHNGKVFSVISPSVITDNAGTAASMVRNVKVAHRDGKVRVTVDSATGHVLSADYYFVWEMSMSVLGMEMSIPFGLEKNFSVEW